MLVSGVVTKFYNAGPAKTGTGRRPAGVFISTNDVETCQSGADIGTIRIAVWEVRGVLPSYMAPIVRADDMKSLIGMRITGNVVFKDKSPLGLPQYSVLPEDNGGMLQLEDGSVASSPAQGPSYSSPSVGAGYADTPSRQELGMAKGNATNAAVLVVVALIEKTGEIPSEADVIEACSRVGLGTKTILTWREDEPDVYVEDDEDEDEDEGEILSIREVS